MVKRIYKFLCSHGAAILAVAAISLAAWEGMENRKHNRLSVLPHIEGSRDYNMLEHNFELSIASTGLGPAVIKGFYVFFDGKLVFPAAENSAWGAVKTGLISQGLVVYQDSTVNPGQFLPPDKSISLVKISGEAKGEKSSSFRESVSRIGIVVCYCSVYGDACSRAKSGLINPTFFESRRGDDVCSKQENSFVPKWAKRFSNQVSS